MSEAKEGPYKVIVGGPLHDGPQRAWYVLKPSGLKILFDTQKEADDCGRYLVEGAIDGEIKGRQDLAKELREWVAGLPLTEDHFAEGVKYVEAKLDELVGK